jgi:hypothetical protein
MDVSGKKHISKGNMGLFSIFEKSRVDTHESI